MQHHLAPGAVKLVQATQRLTKLPVALGFGIATPDHAAAAAQAADAVVVGSMRRETELIDVAGRYLARLSDAAAMTAIPSRHACHAFTPAIAAATASGRVHVWQPKA